MLGSLRPLLVALALLFCARAEAQHPTPVPPVHQQQVQQAAPHGKGRPGSATAIPTKGIKVTPFSGKDGKAGWKLRVPGGRALATPAVSGGLVFVGGGFGSHEFYAFDAKSGKPAWAVKLSDDGPTAAVVSEERVVFNTESCTLFVLDAKTGKHLWSRWLGDPLMSQPAVGDGAIYMAYPGADGDHRLVALALADGAQLFETRIAGDVISAPVIEGDSVYLSTFDGTVYRYRRTDGVLLWKKALLATSAPWIAAGEVHVARRTESQQGPRQEGFITMDKAGVAKGGLKASKSAAWLDAAVQAGTRYEAAQRRDDASVGFGGGAPAVAKTAAARANTGRGTVRGLWEYQGSRPLVLGQTSWAVQGDALRAMDAASGTLLWERKLEGDTARHGGHLGTPPAWAGGRLVVGTTTGELLAFDAATGDQRWRLELKEEIRFQPALSEGRLFVGTATGALYGIETGDETLDGWTMWGGGPAHNGPEGGAR
jgi:Ca-activated chloride channel family protein